MVDSGYSDEALVGVENQESLRSVMVGEKHNIYSSSNSNNYNIIWTNVKPFVNGGLAGLLRKSLAFSYVTLFYHSKDPEFSAEVKKRIPSKQAYYALLKRMPGALLLEASFTSLQLGSFEILTRKVEDANNGMPLTLYQEACCGLTSGAIATYLYSPFYLAHMSMKGDTCQSIFQHLYHKAANGGVLALWKGRKPFANALIAWNRGMLAPYNRCYNYFRESMGLTETRAVIGAGAVSGFFALTCCFPFVYVAAIMETMKHDANGKSYSSSLDCAFKNFRSGGSIALLTVFCKTVLQGMPHTMVLWYLFEKIRKHEESIGMFHCKVRKIPNSERK